VEVVAEAEAEVGVVAEVEAEVKAETEAEAAADWRLTLPRRAARCSQAPLQDMRHVRRGVVRTPAGDFSLSPPVFYFRHVRRAHREVACWRRYTHYIL